MRRIEFSCLFSCIRREFFNQIFINEAQNIVVLSAIHWNIIDQLNQIADGLGLALGIFSQLAQSCFQRVKNPIKYLFVGWRNQSGKGRQSRTNIVHAEIRAHVNPGRKHILVGNKIAQTLL